MFRALAVLVFVACSVSGTQAILCLKGYGMALHDMTGAVTCPEGQTCYVETTMPLDGGDLRYYAGCRDISLCNIKGCSTQDTKNITEVNKRADKPLVICSECCYRSLCNMQGCSGTFGGNKDSIKCFNCKEIFGNRTCEMFTTCARSAEMCMSQPTPAYKHPVPNSVDLGCGNRQQCNVLMKAYIDNNVPRDKWQAFCCDNEDLCNWKPLDNTTEVESQGNKLTCPPDLVDPTANTQGSTVFKTSPITNTQRTTTTTLYPPSTTTTTTSTTTTPAPTTTTTTTTPAPATTTTTTTPAPTTTSTTTTPAPTTTTDAPATQTTQVSTAQQTNKEGTCNFDHGMCGWINMVGDDFDWLLHSGTTPTDDTGPANDHTLGNITGQYIFIETSAPRKLGDKAWLISPRFSPVVRCLTFWYSMYGNTTDSLNVYVSQHQDLPEFQVWQMTGDQGPNWKQAHVAMGSRLDFYIIFEATVGDGYLGDIAFDDVVVSTHPCAAVNIVG